MSVISHQVLQIPTMKYSCLHTVCILQTTESIWLSMLAYLQTGQVHSCLSAVLSVFGNYVLFNCFTGYFAFSFGLFCLDLIWVFVCFGLSLLGNTKQNGLVMILKFSIRKLKLQISPLLNKK